MPVDPSSAPADSRAESGVGDEYSVNEPTEVLAYLQRLMDSRALINLSSPDGGFLTTMLWWVDPAAREIAFSVDEQQRGLEEVASSGESLAVAFLETEKLQFALGGIRLRREAQGLALQCRLPEQIIRFQRRKAFRVRVPGLDAPTLRFRMPDDPDTVIVGRIVDLSLGGCSFLLPTNTAVFSPGMSMPSCRVDLTTEERFVAGFEIRRSVPQDSNEGRPAGVLLGCRWTRLDGAAQRTLQIYVNRVQKRQGSTTARR